MGISGLSNDSSLLGEKYRARGMSSNASLAQLSVARREVGRISDDVYGARLTFEGKRWALEVEMVMAVGGEG